MFVFNVLLLGEDAPRISEQATNFLDRKGTLEHLDNYTMIRIFGSKEKRSPSMSHYGQNVCYRSSKAMQLLVSFFPWQEKKIVHSSALESWGLRVQERQQN